MIRLKFDKKFYGMIQKGVKTQTTRDHLKTGLTDGMVVRAVFVDDDYIIPFYLHIYVNRVVEKKFKYLSDSDAQREGYNRKEELMNVLMDYYSLTPDSMVYCIEFNLVKD